MEVVDPRCAVGPLKINFWLFVDGNGVDTPPELVAEVDSFDSRSALNIS